MIHTLDRNFFFCRNLPSETHHLKFFFRFFKIKTFFQQKKTYLQVKLEKKFQKNF